MAYLFLILTILLETGAVISMKLSAGFDNKQWTITAIITYVLSFVFFTLALKHLSAGVTNAIWAGSSTLLVALIGALWFKEQLGLLQAFFLLLIVIGIVGISLTTSSSH